MIWRDFGKPPSTVRIKSLRSDGRERQLEVWNLVLKLVLGSMISFVCLMAFYDAYRWGVEQGIVKEKEERRKEDSEEEI